MLKGLKKLIFNTDIEDVSEEGMLDDITLPSKAEKAAANTILNESAQEPKEEKKPFVGINADEQKPKPKESVSKERERVRRESSKPETNANAEYEFRPVLSPIFGNLKEEEKNPEEVHDAVHLSKAKTKNPLNTVLSPMYGEYELAAFEKQAKEDLQKRRDKERQLEIEASLAQNAQDWEDEEEILTLDEMIDEDGADGENEPVQISLFGESTPIKEVATSEETLYQNKE